MVSHARRAVFDRRAALFAWWVRRYGMAGVVATAMFAVSAFELRHGRTARMYAELELIGVATVVLADAWLRRPRRWHAPALAALVLTGLLTHVSMFLLAAGLVALAGRRHDRAAWRWRRRGGGGRTRMGRVVGPVVPRADARRSLRLDSAHDGGSCRAHVRVAGDVRADAPPRRVHRGGCGIGRARTARPHACTRGAVVRSGSDDACRRGGPVRASVDRSHAHAVRVGSLPCHRRIGRRHRHALPSSRVDRRGAHRGGDAARRAQRHCAVDAGQRRARQLQHVVAPGDIVAIRPAGKLPELEWSLGVRSGTTYHTVPVPDLGHTAGFEVGSAPATGRTWLLDWSRRPLPAPLHPLCAPVWTHDTSRVLCFR